MLPAGRTLRARRFAPVHLAPLGSTVALADQISREFKVSDQGIDMEIEFNLHAMFPAKRAELMQKNHLTSRALCD